MDSFISHLPLRANGVKLQISKCVRILQLMKCPFSRHKAHSVKCFLTYNCTEVYTYVLYELIPFSFLKHCRERKGCAKINYRVRCESPRFPAMATPYEIPSVASYYLLVNQKGPSLFQFLCDLVDRDDFQLMPNTPESATLLIRDYFFLNAAGSLVSMLEPDQDTIYLHGVVESWDGEGPTFQIGGIMVSRWSVQLQELVT